MQKNREKHVSKKIITQDSIYMVQQFTYVHEIAEISLFLRKSTRCGRTFFPQKTIKNPNIQNNNFSILHTIFTMATKWAKLPLLHRLSLKKSPIKKT